MKKTIDVEILTPLDTRDMGDGKQVKLLQPFRVKVIEHHTDGMIEVRVVEVPKEFPTDYASVPRPFQGIVPRFGLWNMAAAVHDWLFKHGMIEHDKISRRLADQIFLKIMEKAGVRRWRRKVMFAAVRMFGRSLWQKNRDRDAESEKKK